MRYCGRKLRNSFITVYPPQAVRKVILAVDSLVAGGHVAEVAGLLHAVWWRQGLKREEAVVAVHLRGYVCQRTTKSQRKLNNERITRKIKKNIY